ncbi:MAG TPA: hypothetical protein VKE40_13225 [Gemmataceae bacterium]|nr:hypothetical protein [Gemmataceae bacterium]
MLANRVNQIPGAVPPYWNGIPTTCHFATLFWLYWDEFNRQPTQAVFQGPLLNPVAVVQSMLPHGRRLSRPLFGSLTLTPGMVVVFDDGGIPRHSCTARTANTLGGYNQVGWFAGPGVNHGYSAHPTTELRWRGLLQPHDVQGSSANFQWCELVAIPEGVAKAIVRSLVQ